MEVSMAHRGFLGLDQSGSQAANAKHHQQNQHQNHERPFHRKKVVPSLYWLCPQGKTEFQKRQKFLGNLDFWFSSPNGPQGLKVNGPFNGVQVFFGFCFFLGAGRGIKKKGLRVI
jgi:hypothetical protein